MGEELNIEKHKTHTFLYQTDRQGGGGGPSAQCENK